MHTRPPAASSRTLLTPALLALALLTSCGGASSSQRADRPSGVNAGLSALSEGRDGPLPMAKADALSRSDIEALAEKSAVDLESALNQQRSAPDQSLSALAQGEPATNAAAAVEADRATLAAQAAAQGTLPGGFSSDSTPQRAAAATPPDAAARLDQLTDELADLLRRRAQSSQAPLADAIALTGLEAVRPGLMKDLDQRSGDWQRLLAPAEVRSLSTVRGVLADLAQPDTAGDPARLADRLRTAADSLDDASGLRVSRAVLCSRVSGFGQIEPIASNTFVAGRAARAILYIELDRFANRPDTLNAQPAFTVDVSRELGLYADGMLAWHRKAAAVRETSLNRRRDFYLIEEIELPATLGVGRYDLKITVRDKAGGGAVAEYTLPIQLVADASAAG